MKHQFLVMLTKCSSNISFSSLVTCFQEWRKGPPRKQILVTEACQTLTDSSFVPRIRLCGLGLYALVYRKYMHTHIGFLWFLCHTPWFHRCHCCPTHKPASRLLTDQYQCRDCFVKVALTGSLVLERFAWKEFNLESQSILSVELQQEASRLRGER